MSTKSTPAGTPVAPTVPTATTAPSGRTKTHFWREAVYAETRVALPKHVVRKVGYTHTWPISHIMAELTRVAGHVPHVDDPQVPKSVWGLSLRQLADLEYHLYDAASKLGGETTREGKKVWSRQKKSTPTLLVAIASYPEPMAQDTPERRRWVDLVIDACRIRWGEHFVAAVAHEDESHYHLHLVVHNNGESVKPLHAVHAKAAKEQDKKKKGKASRDGGRAVQAWFRKHVAEPMGWARSPKPRPGRVPRPKALAMREIEIEEEGRCMKQRLEAEMRERLAQEMAKAEAYWQQRKIEIVNEIEAEYGERMADTVVREGILDMREDLLKEREGKRRILGLFPAPSPFKRQ